MDVEGVDAPAAGSIAWGLRGIAALVLDIEPIAAGPDETNAAGRPHAPPHPSAG